MARFLLRKILRVLALLFSVLVLMFLLMHAVPGGPWNNAMNAPRPQLPFIIDAGWQRTLDQRFGLDLPLWRQFVRYVIGDIDAEQHFMCGVLCGNLGPSMAQRGRSVQDILFGAPEGKTHWESRFGYSIRLVLFGGLIAVAVGIPLGLLSARNPRSGLSRFIALGLAALLALPNFVLGLLTIIVLASWLKLMRVLPDWSIPSHWIIPALVLAVVPLASIARVTHAAVLNIMHEDYIRTARAKGLSARRIMLKHVLRNALAPILTFLGPTLMELFTGLLVIESLYGFPGFGREYWSAVLALDYSMILGLTLLYAAGFLLINMLIEILNDALDPRLGALKTAEAP